MNRIKKIFQGEHAGFAKYVLIATALFLVIIIFSPGNNVINWVRARIEISRQERQMEEYRRQIEQMEQRIRMLTSDRDTLEKFAREQFNFAEPGEDVYILEDN